MTLRRLLHWKFFFHELLPPVLRRSSPARAEKALEFLGGLLDLARPGPGRRLRAEIVRVDAALGAGWDVDRVRTAVARGIPRHLARDALLDGLSDEEALARFDRVGYEPLRECLDRGTGVVLVGAHFGAHVALLHALHRAGAPARFLVQRPSHTSRYLQGRFDEAADERPQSRFFVRRGLSTGEAAEKILLARGTLRAGGAVYLNGDVLWNGPNTRVGSFLGRERRFLALWTDLAVLTNAPVVFARAEHAGAGRYRLTFDPPIVVEPGGEREAFELYLKRLEAAVAADPVDAVPYLTWPAFTSDPRPSKVL